MSPPLNACKAAIFCGFASILQSVATAQISTPLGGETRVSGPLPGDQVYPGSAFNASGGFAVWQDATIDGRKQGQGIAAIRLDSSLTATGVPFRVNQRTAGHQQHPSVALLTNGGAVVAWQSGVKGDSDIFARFLRADGTFLTGDIQVNAVVTTTRSNHIETIYGYKNNKLRNLRYRLTESARLLRDRNQSAAVSALPDGGAVVAWSGWRRVHTNWMEIVQTVKTARNRSYTNDLPQKFSARQDWMQDVFFQRFDSRGKRVGGEVRANQFARYHQRNPSVAVLPDGSFVVVWVSETFVVQATTLVIEAGKPFQTADVGIYGRLFDATGQPLGSEFKVNTTNRVCAAPSVSALADGRFTVVWNQRDVVRSNSWDIHARVFNPNGTAASDAFVVNTRTYGDQFAPQIASVGANQVVVWTSLGQDGGREGVFGQALSLGAPVGGEFRVNTETASAQMQPCVAGDGAGRFFAVWTSFNVGSSFDLYSQAYGTVQPPGFVGANPPAGAGAETGPATTLTGPLDKLRLNWTARSGARYQVQVSVDLKQWTDVGPPRLAASVNESIGIDATSGHAFYRVVKLP